MDYLKCWSSYYWKYSPCENISLQEENITLYLNLVIILPYLVSFLWVKFERRIFVVITVERWSLLEEWIKVILKGGRNRKRNMIVDKEEIDEKFCSPQGRGSPRLKATLSCIFDFRIKIRIESEARGVLVIEIAERKTSQKMKRVVNDTRD